MVRTAVKRSRYTIKDEHKSNNEITQAKIMADF